MKFDIYGPFVMPHNDGFFVKEKEVTAPFWNKINEKHEGLSEACGCYIFVTRAGKGYTPWYVGQAARQCFRDEVFTPTKLHIYNNVMRKYRSATGVLFFVARKTGTGKFAKPGASKGHSLNFLESFFIMQAITKNPELENKSKTKFLRKCIVPGFLNSSAGSDTAGSSELHRALR